VRRRSDESLWRALGAAVSAHPLLPLGEAQQLVPPAQEQVAAVDVGAGGGAERPERAESLEHEQAEARTLELRERDARARVPARREGRVEWGVGPGSGSGELE